MPPPAIERVASAIDHTLLDASAGAGDIDRLCADAARFGFAAVCVHGRWVARCVGRAGAARVACVVSFPHGLDATSVKEEGARRAVADGADELDVVIAYGLLDDDPAAVGRDLERVVDAAGGATVKAIIEAPVLTPAQLERACGIVAASGAAFAKTGTGTRGPATVEQVAAIRRALPGDVAVKASGGIRTASDAEAMLDAGAVRLGTSAGAEIIKQLDVHAVA
jgi:deoxyribose-phosphate aldolase